MADKRMSETTDQELILEYLEQLKEENQRLKKELSRNKQPKVSVNGDGLRKAFRHWTWLTLTITACVCMIVLTLINVIPASRETGRFYVTHYTSTCGNCYKVVKEVSGGQDKTMTDCVMTKDEAYKVANEFADEWRRLKDKAIQGAESYE